MTTPPKLLLADDSHGDGMLLEMAFAEIGCQVEITRATNGEIAHHLLQDAAAQVPIPFALILLDLNLPKVNGLELLRSIRGWPTLHSVPVVMMTSSVNPSDRKRAEEFTPTRFIVKPNDFHGMIAVAKILAQYVA